MKFGSRDDPIGLFLLKGERTVSDFDSFVKKPLNLNAARGSETF